MKKSFIAAIIIACIIILAGCGKTDIDEKTISNAPDNSASSSQPPEEKSTTELFEQMLADPASIKNDKQFVYTSEMGATERIPLVNQFIRRVQSNEPGSLVGYLLGGTVPIAYELSYTPNGDIKLISYNDHLGLKEYVVTDIYEHRLFYHFTDNNELYFSLPKTDFVFWDKTPIEGYIAGESLESDGITLNPLTAQQAINTAIKTDVTMAAYRERINRQNTNVYGEILSEAFTTDAPVTKPAKIADAVIINNARYYKVEIFENQEQMSDGNISSIYYVAADDTIVFLESMVAGELIPIGYEKVEHFHLGQ